VCELLPRNSPRRPETTPTPRPPVINPLPTAYVHQMSDDLLIRPATVSDAGGIADVYRPYVTDSVISFEEEPPTADEMQRRLLAHPLLPWLVAVRSDHIVGFAYASQHRARAAYRWSADVSIYLHAAERRRGTGRTLYRQLLSVVESLGYVSVFAGVTLPNDASVGLHEALGFTPVGGFRTVGFKRDRWYDVGWWQLTFTDPPAAPPEPRPWQPEQR
jgi:L-amino acid N-acyltransferase YncA